MDERKEGEKSCAKVGRLTHAGDELKTSRKRDETTFLANGRA